MTQELEPDIAALLAQANAALKSDQEENGLDVNEGNVELTADDMNDPDLLAQLAEFGDSASDDRGGDGSDDGDEKVFEEMKSKALQSLQKRILAVTDKATQSRNANNTANYKTCTQVLKELKVLVSQIKEMDAIQFATDKDEIDAQIAQIEENLSKSSVQTNEVNNANSNDGDQEATEQILLQRYKMYKFAAKKAKDAGDRASAINYLKESKAIANYVEEIREGLVIWSSDVPPPLKDELWQIKVIKNNKNVNDDNNNDNAMATLEIVKARIAQYKSAALNTKQEGNIAAAKQYYAQMKEMQNMIPYIQSNQIKVKISDLPKEIKTQTRTKIRERKLSKIEQNGYHQMIQQLRLQIEECKSDASFLSLKDQSHKSQLLQYAKQSQVMLQKVIQCQKLQLEPPKYDRFSINIETLNVNSDIEENECRVTVGKLSNLATKDRTSIYLTFQLSLTETNFQSATKKVQFSADFNMTKRCKIENNKKLKHKIKYGKLNIGLFQDKLFGDVQLGGAIVKLKPLLESSSIVETVQIKPENGRKKIADLTIQIKLRKPVLTDGYTVITKQLIKVTKFPTAVMVPPQTQTQKVKPKRAPTQMQKAKAKPIPKQKQTQKRMEAAANVPSGLTANMVDNPLGIEYIESFECISKEIELCRQQIQQKGGKHCEDLTERLQALNTNKSILEVQVNNGILTLEQYTAKIKKAMITDLTLAKYLKSKNRKLEAVKVLQRYKTMKKEIEGA